MKSSESWPGLLVQTLTAPMILYLMVALFPGVESVNAPGLDNSAIYALNHLPQTEYAFGKDVFYTYGPLGYLQVPMPVGDSLARAMIFRIAIHLLLGALLFMHWRATGNGQGIWVFAVCYLLVNIIGFGSAITVEFFSDYYLIMICGLALSLGLKRERWLAFSLTTCGIISSLLLFIKFNTGLAATATFFVALAVIFTRSPKRWKLLLAAVSIYLITVLVLSLTLVGGLGQMAMWLRTTFEIASEYNVAMSIQGARLALLEGLAAFAVYLALVVWLFLKKSTAGLVGLVFIPVMLMALKSGFVRQEGHELTYFFAASLILCAMVICVERLSELLTATIAFLLVFALMSDVRRNPKELVWNQADLRTRIVNILSLNIGTTKIDRLINFRQWEKSLSEQSQRNLSVLRLPDGWLDNVNRQHQTFDVIPWEINYCPANDLKWLPSPTLQSHTSYTVWLDDLNAGHFRNDNSPDFVLVSFAIIDSRPLLWETPATWRMLLNNYQVEKIKPESNLLMLKKKPPTTDPEWQTIGETVITPHQWEIVPDSESLIFAQLNLSLTVLGLLRKTAFRLPPVMMDVEYDDGHRMELRILPNVARNGLLINYLPRDLEELAKLFNCQATTPIRRFRIMGRGADFLAQTIKVTWKKAVKPCEGMTKPSPPHDVRR